LKLTAMSASSMNFCVRLPCRSSATVIGTSGTTARKRSSKSPSPSSLFSATIAPCRSSISASHPGAAATMASHSAVYTSAATRPLGLAPAMTGTTISAPAASAKSINAPAAVRVPLAAR
jgi:hypothetical protein